MSTRKGMMRAYTVLEVKAIDEERREIEGVATTPTTDRMGDVVEPEGAEFELPIPLLWQHDARAPIGHVLAAKVSKEGITVRARLAHVEEAGKLKDRLDEAWQSIKSGLVRGLSIGFRSLEDTSIKETNGIRFVRWMWLELSAVTIAANGEASITAIKSADQQSLRAAIGAKQDLAVRINPKPGASGSTAAKHTKGKTMKTYKEQIAALEATRAAKAARMGEIQKAAADDARTKDAAEKEEFDTLNAEVKQIDVELKDLRDLEAVNLAAAEPVEEDVTAKAATARPAAMSAARVSINAKFAPGQLFGRQAIAVARAHVLRRDPADIYRSEKRWMETAPQLEMVLRAAVNANQSNTAGAASEWAYAQNVASEFIEYARPMTLVGRIPGFRTVPFNVRFGEMDGGGTGAWIGQGIAANMSRQTSTSKSLGITKVMGLSAITKELAMLSSPSAELLVRDDLARALAVRLDTDMFDPNNGGTANVKPAALNYNDGVITVRSASGTDFAALKADYKALTTNFYAANVSLSGAVWITKEQVAEALELMVTSLGIPQIPSMAGWREGNGRLFGHRVFASQVVDVTGSPDYDNMLILLQPREVFLADDGVASVEASDQVSIQMTDDNSAQKSTATSAGASLVSMFQTESIAIKAVRNINWVKRRSTACHFIRGAAYV